MVGDGWANLQQGDTKGKKKTSSYSGYGIAGEDKIKHSAGLELDCSDSIVNALVLLHSCTKPPTYQSLFSWSFNQYFSILSNQGPLLLTELKKFNLVHG